MVSLYVQNDGSNAKKGVSKSGGPTTHGFGATSFALKAQRCHRFCAKTLTNYSEIQFCGYNQWNGKIGCYATYDQISTVVGAKVYF